MEEKTFLSRRASLMKRVLWCLRTTNYLPPSQSHIPSFPGKSRNLLFITDDLCLEIPNKTGYWHGRLKQKDFGLDSFLSETLWFLFGWERDSWLPMAPQHTSQSCGVRHWGRREMTSISDMILSILTVWLLQSLCENTRMAGRVQYSASTGGSRHESPNWGQRVPHFPPSPAPVSLPPAIFSSEKSCWPVHGLSI